MKNVTIQCFYKTEYFPSKSLRFPYPRQSKQIGYTSILSSAECSRCCAAWLTLPSAAEVLLTVSHKLAGVELLSSDTSFVKLPVRVMRKLTFCGTDYIAGDKEKYN